MSAPTSPLHCAKCGADIPIGDVPRENLCAGCRRERKLLADARASLRALLGYAGHAKPDGRRAPATIAEAREVIAEIDAVLG